MLRHRRLLVAVVGVVIALLAVLVVRITIKNVTESSVAGSPKQDASAAYHSTGQAEFGDAGACVHYDLRTKLLWSLRADSKVRAIIWKNPRMADTRLTLRSTRSCQDPHPQRLSTMNATVQVYGSDGVGCDLNDHVVDPPKPSPGATFGACGSGGADASIPTVVDGLGVTDRSVAVLTDSSGPQWQTSQFLRVNGPNDPDTQVCLQPRLTLSVSSGATRSQDTLQPPEFCTNFAAGSS